MWGRAGAHSGSASVVSAFSSPLLAPGFAWRPSFRGRRCYTHLPPGGLALGVIPTGVRLQGSAVFLLFSDSPRCFFCLFSFADSQNERGPEEKIERRALGVIPTGVRLFFFYFLNLGGGGGKWVPAVFFLSCHKDLGKKTWAEYFCALSLLFWSCFV